MGNHVLDYYGEDNVNAACDITANWNANYSAYSQSFTTLNDGITYKLTSVKLWARKYVSSETGNIQAEIYAHNGTYGTNSTPTGAALATSDLFNVETGLTSVYSLIEIPFSGDQQISLTANTQYVLVVKGVDLAGPSFRIRIGKDSLDSTHSGNEAYWAGAWNVEAHDMCFYVYGYSADLTITETDNVTTNPVAGTYSYTINQEVEVTATPAEHYVLLDWLVDSVSVASTANPYTITMDVDHELTPVMGIYKLTITSVSNGSTYPAAGTVYYEDETDLVIYAKPDRGYILSKWVLNDAVQTSKETRFTVTVAEGTHTLAPAFAARYGTSNLKVYSGVKDLLRRNLGVSDFNVTLHKLSLGAQDADTGLPAKSYSDSTIELLIVSKDSTALRTALGVNISFDAVGFTTSYVRAYDKVTAASGLKYTVSNVHPVLDGQSLVYYKVDLQENKI